MYIFIIRSCISYFIFLPHCMYFWIFKCYHIYFYVNCVVNSTPIEISGNRSTSPIASIGTQCVQQLPVWSYIHIHAHIYLFAYLLFSSTYPVCMYSVCISVKSCYIRTTKTQLFPNMMVQNRQHMDVLGCHLSFNRLISKFFFDSMQISSACIQTSSGCIAVTCTPLATGLYCTKLYYNLPFIKEYDITDMQIFWSFLVLA